MALVAAWNLRWLSVDALGHAVPFGPGPVAGKFIIHYILLAVDYGAVLYQDIVHIFVFIFLVKYT